jgi:hypothetical protein
VKLLGDRSRIVKKLAQSAGMFIRMLDELPGEKNLAHNQVACAFIA